jgi:DNA mismatch repair ATPase MutS
LRTFRGSGAKQVNKYRTPYVEEVRQAVSSLLSPYIPHLSFCYYCQLVQKLELAISIQNEGKARGMELVFARFDSLRSLWATAAQTTALLDALNSLARTATKPGYTRPKIVACSPHDRPSIRIVQGRHPCVESTSTCSEFVPNDLSLGGKFGESGKRSPRVLLLSGPNMVSVELSY